MAVESNVNMYYEGLVESMAERALDNIEDGGYGDEDECIWAAIDDGLMYYIDQAYIVAQGLMNGYITWGKEFDWTELHDMLYTDITKEMEWQREQKEKE